MRSYHSQINRNVSIENMKKLIQYFACVSIIYIATFGCVNKNNQIYGRYERTMELIGCKGMDELLFKRNGIIIRKQYSTSGTGKMHLNQIEYGKWELNKNMILITTDSLCKFDSQLQGFISQWEYKNKLDTLICRKMSLGSFEIFNKSKLLETQDWFEYNKN
jgi:hypothetical protein